MMDGSRLNESWMRQKGMIRLIEGMSPTVARVVGSLLCAIFWGAIAHFALGCPAITCAVALVNYLSVSFFIRLFQKRQRDWRDDV